MLYVVTGGSGSGKSAFAEKMCVELNSCKQNSKCNICNTQVKNKMYYIAHMYPYVWGKQEEKLIDDETKMRIDRHRNMRAGKGFSTIECFTDISCLTKRNNVCGDTILLSECMSNLLANEMYLAEGGLNWSRCDFDDLKQADLYDISDEEKHKIEKCIINPIIMLSNKVFAYVVVTNEIYIDSTKEYEETIRYAKYLAYINRRLVEASDKAYEVVCGIPVDLN